MSKVTQRLLIFFLGVPAVLALISYSPLNHLALNIVMVLFFAAAGYELWGMFSHKYKMINRTVIVLFTALLPLLAYLVNFFSWNSYYIELCFIAEILIVLAIEVFTSKTFEDSNSRILSACFIILYCGYLPTYLSRLCWFKEYSTEKFILFVLLVFISDSIAWVFGMLFGKNNRGIVAASPNKSIAGFIGAYIGDVLLVVLLKYLLLPEASLLKLIILALCICTSSIIGDLTESVLKRSSECKDSGNVILGRGGVLDSIDSIIASAPLYYFLITLITLF